MLTLNFLSGVGVGFEQTDNELMNGALIVMPHEPIFKENSSQV